MFNDFDKTNQALDYYTKALAIKEKLKGKDAIECASTYLNMSLAYKKLGNPRKANEYLAKSKRIKGELKRWLLLFTNQFIYS